MMDGCPYCGEWGCCPTCPGPTRELEVCPCCGTAGHQPDDYSPGVEVGERGWSDGGWS